MNARLDNHKPIINSLKHTTSPERLSSDSSVDTTGAVRRQVVSEAIAADEPAAQVVAAQVADATV